MEIKADCRSVFRFQVKRACCQFPAEFNRLAAEVNSTSGQLEASAIYHLGKKQTESKFISFFKEKARVCIVRLIGSPLSTCSGNSSSFSRQSGGKRGLECYLNISVSTGNFSARGRELYSTVDLEFLYIAFYFTQFLTQLSYSKFI